MKYVVCYDITDGKRLRRIAKILRRYGQRVEKSVFECELAEKDYEKLYCLMSELAKGRDVIHIYGIPVHIKCVKIGKDDDLAPQGEGGKTFSVIFCLKFTENILDRYKNMCYNSDSKNERRNHERNQKGLSHCRRTACSNFSAGNSV